MKHITSFSGGAASFAVAVITQEKYGKENTLFTFCDTLIEDEDLYRFLIEGAAALEGSEIPSHVRNLIVSIPPVFSHTRPAHLAELSKETMAFLPRLRWLTDGRDPWQVFRDERYQGNTRTAHCTVELKGKVFARWLTSEFKPDECIIHFGFDWAEEHRLVKARENWAPYICDAPLCAPPYLNRAQIFQMIDDYDIEQPRLYELDFVHNNCGGFCVKAGQAHFANLYRKMRPVYDHHEGKQEQLMKDVPTVRPFLRMNINKKTHYLTLKQFRIHLERGGVFDEFEYGGCGCFSEASSCGLAALVANDNEHENS